MIPAISSIGVGPLGSSEWSIPGIGSVTSTPAVSTAATGAANASGFSGALTNAISSLDATQNNATTATTQLADGQATDPTQAVTAVENASLEMDYASQIRNQLDSAATTIFQTQM